MFEEYDVVRLIADLPELGLRSGAVGAIVMIHTVPRLAYEIEIPEIDQTFTVDPEHIEGA